MQTVWESTSETDSALAMLGLSNDELAALTKQGFISAEMRGRGLRYKLRFRVDGKQRVRCLGMASAFVEQVRAEVGQLQHRTRLRRELGDLMRASRRRLRAAKQQLRPLLRKAGYAFHGMAVRRFRSGVRP